MWLSPSLWYHNYLSPHYLRFPIYTLCHNHPYYPSKMFPCPLHTPMHDTPCPLHLCQYTNTLHTLPFFPLPSSHASTLPTTFPPHPPPSSYFPASHAIPPLTHTHAHILVHDIIVITHPHIPHTPPPSYAPTRPLSPHSSHTITCHHYPHTSPHSSRTPHFLTIFYIPPRAVLSDIGRNLYHRLN